MSAKHGLVIGKFYPPHRGHHLLIRTAASVSERVTVVVMASSVESVSMEQRVAWLREVHEPEANVTVTGIHDDVRIDFEDDAVWQAHVALMLQAARAITPVPIDAVFTSEPYGDELGRRLHARHVLVDEARTLAPGSSTLVRRDPTAAWELIAPPVRQALALRVVLVGAESTGKTTLARALAEHLRARGAPFDTTTWVPEFGREASVDKLAHARARAALAGTRAPAFDALHWTTSDFVHIAREQNRLEDEAARHHGPLVICDTDAFATSVWHARYMGTRSPEVDALARADQRLYLLSHHDDVPFTQDGIRDGESIRAWMTAEFAERLTHEQRDFAWLRGPTLAERLDMALTLIDARLRKGWHFRPPLTVSTG